jgi:hypothetical protein
MNMLLAAKKDSFQLEGSMQGCKLWQEQTIIYQRISFSYLGFTLILDINYNQLA